MFTGIITDVGSVLDVVKHGDTRLRIATAFATGSIDIGASVACSGVCLTVVSKGGDWFAVDASAETLSCTTLGTWVPGTRINLERALRVGDELGGHIVSGHVDGVGQIVAREPEGESVRLVFEVPQSLSRFIARKGAVALDGVSLTVNDVVDRRFGINLIPHTQKMTTFGSATVGSMINVEIDVLARYVARLGEAGAG
jgi:riboflavin synthase